MTFLIIGLQILTLLTLWYLLGVGLKLTAEIATSNSKQLKSLVETTKRMEVAAALVAQDLSDAHFRADSVVGMPHGAAADAAAQQTEREKLANNNPKLR